MNYEIKIVGYVFQDFATSVRYQGQLRPIIERTMLATVIHDGTYKIISVPERIWRASPLEKAIESHAIDQATYFNTIAKHDEACPVRRWIVEKSQQDYARGALEQEPYTLDFAERKAIIRALLKTNGNRREACRLLGIGKTTLYRKISDYGLTNEYIGGNRNVRDF